MRGESVIRSSGRTLPVANRLAICSSVVVAVASSVLLTAQNVVLTGALSGRVTDQSGAVVTGASVVVQNLGTSVKQSAETNHTGLYRFLALTPGSYSIAVSLKGFRNVQAGPVRVLIGNTAQLDVKLQVGATGDTVKVSGTAPLLQNAIQEAQVAVSPYSAVYGGGAGFINTVTRSGSNAFQGNAFYYNRNSKTGANDALSKASGFPKPQDALQQFGAVGGPILRDRLWFFVDYEQQLENDPISIINPPLAQLDETSFGIPAGPALPAPNAPYPIPGSDSAPHPTNPLYLQQVSNTLNSNLGIKATKRDDLAIMFRLDYQASSRDSIFLSFNVNRFNSPRGVITPGAVRVRAVYGKETSGRPYAGLLSPACTSSTLSFGNCNGANDNLNDTAFNQDTANTAAGINGAGPTPGLD